MASPDGSETALGPLATPLPPPPQGENFTKAQWDVLLSIMDAVIPRVVRESKATGDDFVVSEAEYKLIVERIQKDEVTVDAYLAERPSENEEFQDLLMRQLVFYATDEQRSGLKFMLFALSTRAGSLFLTGSTTPMNQLGVKSRLDIINGWRTHYLPPLRILHKSFTSLAKNLYLKTSRLFPVITGYTAIPLHYRPGPSFDFKFLQFPTPAVSAPAVLDFDVVIVGSGVGGGVSAKNLAEAGFSVLVVDKSYYYPPASLPMTEAQAHIHMFDNGGVSQTQDGSVNIITGSNFGGGGSINWSACLQTQGYVRKEWAKTVPMFASEEFQEALDRVGDRMGVSDKHIRHNHGNRVLLEGARRLGYDAKAVPQNTAGNEHYCGHCAIGCSSAEKQGPNVCWLPDAARAGAQFIEGLEVERVLLEKGKAVGIKGVWTSRAKEKREVVVKARRVIVSAGSIYSPLLLKKSGLKNKQIGRNLYLHPVNFITAFFDASVRPWEGGILTSVCSSFEDLDGHGHGVKLEPTCMLPTLSAGLLWQTGLDWKLLAAKYPRMNSYISLARDRDAGRVYPGPDGGPRVEYTPSAFDRRHVVVGLLALAKILLVAGAKEIHVDLFGARPYTAGGSVTSPEFVSWLAHIEAVGNAPPMGIFACAHQMGSNRMSATAGTGVVDGEGRVWGTEGLYVADASVFPSASGVNPMMTNLAISDLTSRKIAKGLGKGGSKL